MIATRLHVKRLSSAVPHRPSVSSLQSPTLHPPISPQRRSTQNRCLDEIQTIDSDHSENNDDENTQVERSSIFFCCLFICIYTNSIYTYVYSIRDTRSSALNIILSTVAFIDHFY